MELFYRAPAACWEETLPVGNGSLGGMLFGAPGKEVIGLNEESVWSGFPEQKTNPQAALYLQEVRTLVAQGRYYDAERVVEQHMLGKENESYLPLGMMQLAYAEQDQQTEQYRRSLDLETAIATVNYRVAGVEYTRECFASYPGQAIWLRLTCSQPVSALDIMFDSQLQTKQTIAQETPTWIDLTTYCPEHVSPAARADLPHAFVQGTRGKVVHSRIAVMETDGICVSGPVGGLRVEHFTSVVLRVSAVRPPVGTQNYEQARVEHIEDYRRLYSRMTLFLGEQPDLPTDERLRRLAQGENDPALYALYVQYGRYLLISASLPGSLPANLQGIWNWELHAPWRSNWTTNINVQMNYWPVHSCNLQECFEPYIAFMQRVCENGQVTARENYGCRGFTVHHNVDCWNSTTPVGITWDGNLAPGAAGWGMWPVGGLWLCELLLTHYRYTQDKEYLHTKALPVLREAVLFVTDWVYEEDGVFHTCPSTSPENRFLDDQGRSCAISRSCTMDTTLIRMTLQGYCDACRALGCEDALCRQAQTIMEKLPAPVVAADGRLLEWEKDFAQAEPGHRHISHLYGLFPCELFEKDAKLREACRVSLEHRLRHGGGHTGWSLAWILNIYAVLGDNKKFGDAVKQLLTRSTYPNLWDAHPPFQIDGNFGGTAAIANMLAHERGGKLHLLAALPPEWKTGYVRGLCLPGNRCIDLAWQDGVLLEQRIYAFNETVGEN